MKKKITLFNFMFIKIKLTLTDRRTHGQTVSQTEQWRAGRWATQARRDCLAKAGEPAARLLARVA